MANGAERLTTAQWTKVAGLLGLGVRARTVVVGVEQAKFAVKRGRVSLAVLADDASPNSKAKVEPLLQARQLHLGQVLVLAQQDAAQAAAGVGHAEQLEQGDHVALVVAVAAQRLDRVPHHVRADLLDALDQLARPGVAESLLLDLHHPLDVLEAGAAEGDGTGGGEAGIDGAAGSLDALLELSARHEAEGLGDAPWPPQYLRAKPR